MPYSGTAHFVICRRADFLCAVGQESTMFIELYILIALVALVVWVMRKSPPPE